MAPTDLASLRAGATAGVTRLDLSGCDLAEVPPEVFEHAETLEALDLSGNRLTDLPDDFAKLTRLRRLFCSHNPFRVLPGVLGQCPQLSQIGFRGCGLRELPLEALPPTVRWLTLTDNALQDLPPRLGERTSLQKLMLAGNRLRALPESLAGAPRLELLRVAANDLEALPSWLAEMPALSWLAFAGNPAEACRSDAPIRAIAWAELELGPLLGEGASGRIHAARWAGDKDVAVKLFKGAMTSDGLPERERAASLAAGLHPNLVGAIGWLTGHPEDVEGLVMPLLPAHWRVLAGPPSAVSCSRDVYAADFTLPVEVALRIARGVGAAAAHLHARGLMHGDLYAHNTLWDGASGEARLGDFGAASFLAGAQQRLTPCEVRAWGILLGELLDISDGEAPAGVRDLQRQCVAYDPSARPTMRDALDALAGAAG